MSCRLASGCNAKPLSSADASPRVSVDLAAAAERPLLEGLFQFYIYDFAAMYPAGEFKLGPDGRYAHYPHLESYWAEEGRLPFVIRVDGQAAGLALINRYSHRHAAIDHAVAEFFVMRPYRRGGAGRIAAHTLFARLCGRWELAIAAPNSAARRFWPGVVASAPGVTNIETVDLPSAQAHRRILSFTIA